ncbi:helix-turn-helix domain-containing protein [Rosenbergiella sp. S61]|uniref:Helix-turn-helix domain-containing protein n=2 Tax=Rosenbergiella gaditana TaxID=2726987 RepID=A0ABS5T1U3_9GAMM|nr:helix-turn-helix domain-containing protein [Rosenbergiella gaditana]
MKQKELNLNNSELLLLIQILSFIHHADTEAYPSIATLSKRINQHPRTVQRTINSLEKKKILKKTIRSKSPKDVGKSNIYSVEPLIAKLQKMRQETI